MKKTLQFLQALEKWIIVIAFAIMVIACFIQVVNRNIFRIPVSGFEEAAKYSSLSVEWIKKKNLSGELSYYKPGGPGGKVLINIADLDRLINKSKVI